MTDLTILYEHPSWFEPLFSALDARGISYAKAGISGQRFDPAASSPPAPLVLNRVAMSSVLRNPEHGIFYAQSLLAHWESIGAHVLNGPDALALDSSKARQLSLISSLGLAAPRTRVIHRVRDLLAATEGLGYPVLVKANVGGAGAGISKYSTAGELAEAIAAGQVPTSVDSVLLVQEYVPARDGKIIRIETLGGRYLYAIEVESGGDNFDLCPADVCLPAPGRPAAAISALEPSSALIESAERIVKAAGIDVGGVELLIDDRTGHALFYDINALSNFVGNPHEVLGWDPHERLVDFLEIMVGGRKAA